MNYWQQRGLHLSQTSNQNHHSTDRRNVAVQQPTVMAASITFPAVFPCALGCPIVAITWAPVFAVLWLLWFLVALTFGALLAVFPCALCFPIMAVSRTPILTSLGTFNCHALLTLLALLPRAFARPSIAVSHTPRLACNWSGCGCGQVLSHTH